MFADWNVYYKPLHLNNTTGVGIAGGDIAGASTTPFVVLAEADGNSYTPKTTNYMDVYSGGSPFTFTQELVQRGAEVQEDSIRIAIIGTTPQDCADKLQQLRTALTNQHLFGPQILSIKKLGQSEYTEWLIHGAVVQEETTYLGRDIQDNGYPSLFVTITITRSPYGADSFSLYTYTQDYPINAQFQSIPNTNVLDNPHLYGSFVNFYINLYNPAQIYAPATLGSTVIATTIEDTKIVDTTAVSGLITSGAAQVTAKTVSYPITDTSNGNYPIQVFVIATVQDNEIQMRLDVGGYSTSFVRSIGTQLNPATISDTRRLFVLPPVNIKDIFSGARDYSVYYGLDISIVLNNLSRVYDKTYTIHEVYVCRIDNIIQVFPTTDTSAKTFNRGAINISSFYDQLNYPSQPLPFIKGQFTQYANISGANKFNNNSSFEESLEIRGTNIIMKKPYGNFSYIIFTTAYNGSSPNYNVQSALENVIVRFSPTYLSIKE